MRCHASCSSATPSTATAPRAGRPSEMSRAEWLTLAYSDRTWVTQVAGVMAGDAAPIPVPVERPTSSSTQPSLVVRML